MLGWHPGHGGRAEASAIVGASSTGTVVTSATANTKGSWASLGITPSVAWAMLGLSALNATADEDGVIDVGQGDGTTNGTTVLVPDLRLPGGTNFSGALGVTLPLRVQPGVALYARIAKSVTGSRNVQIMAWGNSMPFGFPGYGSMVALYAPSSSRGVAIDPGGTANTVGSWTQLSAGVTSRVAAFMLEVGPNATASRTGAMDWLVDVGVGAGGSQVVVGSALPLTLWLGVPASSQGPCIYPLVSGPIPCDVAPSTVWWVRARCSANTASTRLFDAALHGFVP